MIALRTSLNGRQLTLAGAGDLAVLHTIVNALGKLGPQTKPQREEEVGVTLLLSVGGLTNRLEGDDEHLRWVEQQELSLGDEVLIELVDVPEVDPPVSRASAASSQADRERSRFEEAKRIISS